MLTKDNHNYCQNAQFIIIAIIIIIYHHFNRNRPDEDVPDVTDQYRTVLGYNEPNQADKADLTPEEAAYGWIELQEKYPNKVFINYHPNKVLVS